MNKIYQKCIPGRKNPVKRRLGGFTLTELLAVLLIIGILAAVALAQYTRAVERGRAAKLWPLLNALKAAQERYYMASGAYAESFEYLDISLNWKDSTKKHHFDGINTVSLFNGSDMSVYIGYPPYRSCVFAMVARGKFYPKYMYGNGLGYCFDRSGLWFPEREVFCLENKELEQGEFCRRIMDFNTLYGGTWHRYFIR